MADEIRAYDPRKGDLSFDRPPGHFEPSGNIIDFLMKALTDLQMGQAPAGIATMPGGPGGYEPDFAQLRKLSNRNFSQHAQPWTGSGTGGYEALPETQLNQAFKDYMTSLNENVGGINIPKSPGVTTRPPTISDLENMGAPAAGQLGWFKGGEGGWQMFGPKDAPDMDVFRNIPRYAPYPIGQRNSGINPMTGTSRPGGGKLVSPDTELSETWWQTLAPEDMKNAPQGQGYIPPKAYGQLHEEYPGYLTPGTIFQGYEVLKDILRTAVKQFTPQGQQPPRKPPGL